MKAEKCIDFLKHLVSEASGKLIVFTDRHPAHEAKTVEEWLEGRKSQIEVEWLALFTLKVELSQIKLGMTAGFMRRTGRDYASLASDAFATIMTA